MDTLRNRLSYLSVPEPNTGCFLWLGPRTGNGYGAIKIGKKMCAAHRIVYEEFVGPIPPGLLVCHKCDVPLCVNPAHLFLGTNKDNMLDAARKGRTASGDRSWPRLHPEKLARGGRNGQHTHPEKTARGERNGGAKLKLSDVVEIRRLLATGLTQQAVARMFSISNQQMSNIANRRSWVLG